MTSPASPSLRTLAGAVIQGDTSARALIDESLRRIEAHSELGAVVATRAADARVEADALDEAIRRGADPGPLAGIPVLVKDNTDIRGMPTTHGSLLYADASPAPDDGLVVARLRAAGAIVVGKSNVPEFCIEGFTDNLLFGPSRNPWRLDRSPGGSSGGSAAALAGGLVPVATGTDGGGSVRIPAGFCGLVGYKPTNGVIGRRTPPDWIDFSTDGILATSVEDAELLLMVLKGPVDGDPTALPSPLPPQAEPRRLIVAERTDDLGPLPADVSSAFHDATKRLARILHLSIEHRTPDWFFSGPNPDEDWFTIAAAEHVSALGRERLTREISRLHASAQEFLEFGMSVAIDEYLRARRRRFDAVARMDHILEGHTILATPTIAVPGFAPDGRRDDGSIGMLGPEVYSTAVQNMTGHPAMSLPAGPYPDGLPFGIQLTMSRWADRSLFAVAHRWEKAFPWPRTAPGYPAFDPVRTGAA